jgi:hypothetical protein
VLAWLALEHTRVRQVRAGPRNAASRAHVDLEVAADLETGVWDAECVHDTGLLTMHPQHGEALLATGAAASVHRGTNVLPFELPRDLGPELDARTDRVVGVRLQTFRARVHRVAYQTPFGRGQLEVTGARTVTPEREAWQPLAARRQLLGAAACVLAAHAILAYSHYQQRHAWFVRHGHGGLVLGLALATAVLGVLAIAGLLLPRGARTPRRTWLPLAGTVLALGATVAAFCEYAPKASTARAALSSGDFERARLEGEALDQLGIDPQAGAAIVDQVRRAATVPLR